MKASIDQLLLSVNCAAQSDNHKLEICLKPSRGTEFFISLLWVSYSYFKDHLSPSGFTKSSCFNNI